MKLRYGAKIGLTFYPSGTEVRPADIEEVRRKTWLTEIEYRTGANFVAVYLPDRDTPTLFREEEILP